MLLRNRRKKLMSLKNVCLSFSPCIFHKNMIYYKML